MDQEVFELYMAALVEEYELKVSGVNGNEYQISGYFMYPALKKFINITGAKIEEIGNQTTVYTYVLGS